MENKKIEWKDLEVTHTGNTVILSYGKRSVELLVFSEEDVKKLQEIADKIYAEKNARCNKLAGNTKQKN